MDSKVKHRKSKQFDIRWISPSPILRIAFGFSLGVLFAPFNNGWVYIFVWYFISMLIAQWWCKDTALNATVFLFSLIGYFLGRYIGGFELE